MAIQSGHQEKLLSRTVGQLWSHQAIQAGCENFQPCRFSRLGQTKSTGASLTYDIVESNLQCFRHGLLHQFQQQKDEQCVTINSAHILRSQKLYRFKEGMSREPSPHHKLKLRAIDNIANGSCIHLYAMTLISKKGMESAVVEGRCSTGHTRCTIFTASWKTSHCLHHSPVPKPDNCYYFSKNSDLKEYKNQK